MTVSLRILVVLLFLLTLTPESRSVGELPVPAQDSNQDDVALNEDRYLDDLPKHDAADPYFESQSETAPAPWEINQGVCPPSICQGKDAAESGFDDGVSPFYEGDIILTMEQRRLWRHTNPRRRRAIVRSPILLWPNARVPYKIDKKLSNSAKKAIRAALRHLRNTTCVRFLRKTKRDKDFIFFVNEPGCWSKVGRQQGEQRIGAGSIGCDYRGTMVHETAHSLGMWHEQSRTDRDKYIKVNFKELSSSGPPNFQIQNFSSTTSLNYPYDYQSIMHYGARYFSNTGRKTIEVINIGKKLNLKIGNRKALSDIDIAQLRDMYQCNRKPDAEQASCPQSWTRLESGDSSSCYGFYFQPQQYSKANRFCSNQNAHLLHIDSMLELQSVSKILEYYAKRQKAPKATLWRIGGRRINGTFWWHRSDGRFLQKVRHAQWKQGHPASFSSIGLEYDKNQKDFKWVGLWTGSHKDLPKYAYPFICEKDLITRKCYRTADRTGQRYRGKHDYTESGITCQSWTSRYPRQIKWTKKEKEYLQKHGLASQGLGRHRYCRNPFGKEDRPWCYTTRGRDKREFCDVLLCDPKTKRVYDYRNSRDFRSPLP